MALSTMAIARLHMGSFSDAATKEGSSLGIHFAALVADSITKSLARSTPNGEVPAPIMKIFTAVWTNQRNCRFAKEILNCIFWILHFSEQALQMRPLCIQMEGKRLYWICFFSLEVNPFNFRQISFNCSFDVAQGLYHGLRCRNLTSEVLLRRTQFLEIQGTFSCH